MSRVKIVLEDGTDHTFDRADIEEGFVVCRNRKSVFDEDDTWWQKIFLCLQPGGMMYIDDVQAFPEHRIEKMEEV